MKPSSTRLLFKHWLPLRFLLLQPELMPFFFTCKEIILLTIIWLFGLCLIGKILFIKAIYFCLHLAENSNPCFTILTKLELFHASVYICLLYSLLFKNLSLLILCVTFGIFYFNNSSLLTYMCYNYYFALKNHSLLNFMHHI